LIDYGKFINEVPIRRHKVKEFADLQRDGRRYSCSEGWQGEKGDRCGHWERRMHAADRACCFAAPSLLVKCAESRVGSLGLHERRNFDMNDRAAISINPPLRYSRTPAQRTAIAGVSD
jgi:hypothetical protein